MIIKKTMLFLFIFVLSANIYAQDKQIKKLQQLYENSDYQKCIDKATNVASTYNRNPIPLYYSAFSNFQLYKGATPVRQKYYLTNCLNKLSFGLMRDIDSSEFANFKDITTEIHDTTFAYALRLWGTDKDASGFFFKALASVFNDTTPEYIELYVPVSNTFVQSLAFSSHQGPVNQVDVAGNKQGVWIKKYPDGTVEYEIFFKDNHPAGVYRKYYENGRIKADMYFNQTGNRASAIMYNDQGNRIAMGYYTDKQKDSLWQYFVQDSIVVSEETFIKGVKNGPERTYSLYSYPNLLEEKFWVNGKMDSTWSGFYRDGSPRFVANYIDGIRQGKYLAFGGSDKPVIIGNYKDNLPDGTWNYWDDSTQVYIKVDFKEGKPVNLIDYTDYETSIIQGMIDMQGTFEEPDVQIQSSYGDF